jgi:hypothetical protein
MGHKVPRGLEWNTEYQFDDGARPDLAMIGINRESVSAAIEVKVDAILTPNQPEGYIMEGTPYIYQDAQLCESELFG